MAADSTEWILMRQVSAVVNVSGILLFFPTLGVLIKRSMTKG
jgi:hypothetical protein